ncbi:MAG TPA: hypothetical protein VMT54_00675 [Candidatus Cybelea sp.]|nr:hypothetical protein [Candidatus Cybelea sp.]
MLREAKRLADAGKLAANLDPERYTLETVGDAYRAISERTAAGKLIADIG